MIRNGVEGSTASREMRKKNKGFQFETWRFS